MRCRELEVEAASDLLTQLTRLGSCLTACVPLRLAAASELVQVALHFLNFEGRHLFMSLAQMQLAVIEKFFDFSPEVAKSVLAPMEASLKQSEELAKYMRFCQQIIHTSTNSTELKVRALSAAAPAPSLLGGRHLSGRRCVRGDIFPILEAMVACWSCHKPWRQFRALLRLPCTAATSRQ